jgi:hypothetical protein
MSEKTATFNLRLRSDAGDEAAHDAAELEKLRQKLSGSQDAVKQLSSSLRMLRGDTVEVKGAKEQLKGMLNAEKDAISAANLELLKHGTTYEKLAEQERKAAREKAALDARMKSDAIDKEKKALKDATAKTDGLRKAVDATGGPLADFAEGLDKAKVLAAGASTGVGLLVVAAAALVAGLVIATATLIGGAVALARFVLEAGNAARAMGLMREAAAGSAANGYNLGTQVDALSRKVATAKDKLNQLASTLTRQLSGSYASGQAIVDTFNLVAQSSEAMGDEVGNQLGDIIKRGKQFGRIQINPFELQGTGINFQDVAKELSKNLKIGLGDAQQALYQGYIKIDDGAKAIRAVVEKRFGEVNAKKLLDLNVIVQKFHEHLADLTRGVNLEPLLAGLDRLSKLFDISTVTGAALKDLVTDFGNLFVSSFANDGVPAAEKFIKTLVIGAYKIDIAFLKMKAGVTNALKTPAAALALRATLYTLGVIVGSLAVTVAAAGAAIAVGLGLTFGPIAAVAMALVDLYKFVAGIEWSTLGTRIIDGIKSGILAGWTALKGAVTGTVERIKGWFTGGLAIRSPSKVFEGYGQQTTEGYARGVEGRSGRAQSAVDSMTPSAGAGPRGGGGRGNVIVQVEINVSAPSGDGPAIAKSLSDASFLAGLTRVLEQACRQAGIPTTAET